MLASLALAALLAVPAAAEDAFVKCDRGASLDSLSADGRDTLAKNGFFLDESRRVVPGSRYFIQYLYFTVPAKPAEVMAVYLQFARHPSVFRDAVSSAAVSSWGKGWMKVFLEEKVPFAFVPKPRYTLAATLSALGAGGYRLDLALDNYEDNSSHPSWYDSFFTALPHPRGTLVIHCKYVVPSDKRLPGVANDIVRGRLLRLPHALRDWVAAEKLDHAFFAKLRTEFEAGFAP